VRPDWDSIGQVNPGKVSIVQVVRLGQDMSSDVRYGHVLSG